MAEYGRGAKAGLLAGLVSGIIVAVLYVALLTIFKNEVVGGISSVQGVSTPAQLYSTLIEFVATVLVVTGIVLGAIFGAFFSLLYLAYLKKSSLRIRGVVFAIVLWLIGLAIFGIGGSGTDFFLIQDAGFLGAFLVYGYLLGYFFERFAPKSQPVADEPKWPPSESSTEVFFKAVQN